MREIAKGSFLALFGAVCWGVSGCVAQYLFEYEGMDSNWLTPLRLGLAGVVLFLYYLLRSKKDRQALFAPWRDPRDAIDLVIYGLVGVSGCQFLYFLTIQLSTAGVATILQNLSPVMVLGVTCLQARRAPRAFEIVSIVLALVGLFLLTTHGSLTGLVISPAALVSGLLSGVCVVLYTMWPRRLQSRHSTPVMQCWAFVMGGAVFGFVFAPWASGYVPSLRGVLGIVFVSLIGNVLAFCCFMQGVKMVGAQRANLYTFAEPVTAALLSTLLLGSPFTWIDAVGFACIFAMLTLLSLPPRKNAEQAAAAVK